MRVNLLLLMAMFIDQPIQLHCLTMKPLALQNVRLLECLVVVGKKSFDIAKEETCILFTHFEQGR